MTDPNNLNAQTDLQTEEQDSSLNLRAILEMTWALRYWIILSVFLALGIAAVYLHRIPKSYTSSMMIMITTDKNAGMTSSAQMSLIQDLTGNQTYNSLANEKVIIKSTPVLQQVVMEADLNIRYYVRHNFVNRETGIQEVKMTFIPAEGYNLSQLHTYRFDYDIVDERHLQLQVTDMSINKKSGLDPIVIPQQTCPFDTLISLGECGAVNFTFRPDPAQQFNGKFQYAISGNHYIILTSPLIRARELATQITVDINEDKASSRMGGGSSILQLTMTDNLPARAELVLGKMVEEYNTTTKNYYSTSNSNTMTFLENRLKDLHDQLTKVENKKQTFSVSSELIDIDSQASISLNSEKAVQDQIQEIRIQIRLLEMVQADIAQNAPYTTIPSNIGIADQSINSSIAIYNSGCIERIRRLTSSTEKNPVIMRLSTELDAIRNQITESIKNQIKLLQSKNQELQSQLNLSKDYLQNIPGQKINLQQIEREQSIIEPLYLQLQQKREETMLAIVAEPDVARVVEYPENTAVITGPNSSRIYAIAFVLGFLLPIGIVYLISLMRTKIQTPEDISARTRVPIIGIVPISEAKVLRASDIINNTKHSATSEIFRSIRTNIGFMKGKVIQVTSSIPGEGKSFISSNLAISLAQIGKKVILVEADMRKGHMNRTFELPRRDNHGLANYLSGEVEDWRETVKQIKELPTLDVILKGAVPPNPNELLSSDRMDTLIQELCRIYDYVILDSPPFLVIADPMTLNRLVDRNLYVMRAGVSDLRFAAEINNAVQSHKLNNPMIILNAVDVDRRNRYGYSYGYGYGYGYGYRYGYAYGYGNDEEQHVHRGLRWRLKRLFTKS